MNELFLKSCKCGCGMTFRVTEASKQEYATRLHNPEYEWVYGEKKFIFSEDESVYEMFKLNDLKDVD